MQDYISDWFIPMDFGMVLCIAYGWMMECL